jgi:hypothetical protein
MRLSDLNPCWFRLERDGPRVGLTFECPCCREVRLGISFNNRGREAINDNYIHLPGIWSFEGLGIHDLTVYPQINVTDYGHHWFGRIENGLVKTEIGAIYANHAA